MNAAVYGSIAIGLAVRASKRRGSIAELGPSYASLEAVLKKRFPDLPAGFTLREGLARARKFAPDLDWAQVQQELWSYEAHRYGTMTSTPQAARETSKLVRVLGSRWR